MLPGDHHDHPSVSPLLYMSSRPVSTQPSRTAKASAADVPRLSSFVGGEWRASDGDEWMDSVNPSNRRDVVARVPVGTAADVAAAVVAARSALDAWRRVPGPV